MGDVTEHILGNVGDCGFYRAYPSWFSTIYPVTIKEAVGFAITNISDKDRYRHRFLNEKGASLVVQAIVPMDGKDV